MVFSQKGKVQVIEGVWEKTCTEVSPNLKWTSSSSQSSVCCPPALGSVWKDSHRASEMGSPLTH